MIEKMSAFGGKSETEDIMDQISKNPTLEKGHHRKSSSLQNNIKRWLEQASMFPNEDRSYDPNDYSIEEWETYLRKKNNNLNFDQFLTRRRWVIATSAELFDAQEYKARLMKAAENSNEFLTAEEMKYVDAVIQNCDRLHKKYSELKISSADRVEAGVDPKEIAAELAKVRREMRLACQYKYVTDQSLVAGVETEALVRIEYKIINKIKDSIRNAKDLWEYRRSRNSEIPQLDS